MRLLCLKHVPFEGPGLIALWANESNYSLKVKELYQGDTLPQLDSFDFLLIMGGPMNVYEETEYPWLKEEKDFIKRTIDAGKFTLGICLGAQLIASALGSKVYANDPKEIGWFPVFREPSTPSFIDFPPQLEVLHWHGDTFNLPEGAKRITRSDKCLNQAFTYGKHVMGLQFHLEMDIEQIQLICRACANELSKSSETVQTADRIQSPKAQTLETTRNVLRELLNSFIRQG